ncbi:bifunctional folylpolyglutamate synthase/dihydrofolate synthase [Novosphingobium sp. FSY-8]|uniref:Bifunctional folylpolyglutamate synthase/dihydrofolate synthase n=1 Tax=Novosphingobium ovatum TaxID=1908523 RepID=A0ABW9XBG4_9SPHN|nr:folylpolyglutamate synthase/dihydrofolate synthase family protein [Novosphingobium ovatum]NBC35886.1 bifunctional folylpolyglutamate synthase/dihydrofolate synthase [Novosphingobium ovatum]
MKDFAISDHPRVAAQLARLGALSVPQGRLGLEIIEGLLDRLGNPQRRLPPVFHVAGTNGKGSTCTYLRHMLEAQGLSVHSATKPHLVRYNERIRLNGALISDDHLADLLARVLDANEAGGDLGPSFFEVTTAAIFLAFAETPADACVIEVGLGGRLDATNVIPDPLVTGIATLGIDHEGFLLRPEDGAPADPLARIAWEKAGITRPHAPLVTLDYPPRAEKQIAALTAASGAPWLRRGRDWSAQIGDTIAYRDAAGTLDLPLPMLAGRHQAENAALAVAMLRAQSRLTVTPEAMAQGIRAARWPARLQLLNEGPLVALARRANPTREVWLDGGHNPDAGAAIARHFATRPPVHLIMGMLANKDPSAIVTPLTDRLLSVSVVPAPGHDAHTPEDFAAHTPLPVRPCDDVEAAIAALPEQGDVLICGSLYLAGDVLRRNLEFPD